MGYLKAKPFLYLLPILLLYTIFIVYFYEDNLSGDQARYIRYAENLTHGYFSNPESPSLGNGPGYSLLLYPFVSLDAPHLVLRLLNAPLMFLACLFVFFTLSRHAGFRTSLFISYLFGLFPQFVNISPFIITESFSIFLLSGFMYFLFGSCEDKGGLYKVFHFIFASIFFGYLALTKIIFGYVIVFGIAVHAFFYFVTRNVKSKIITGVYCGAFLVCIPWLFYTYKITGEYFYWGDPAGDTLYWMTTPEPEILGWWYGPEGVWEKPELEPYREFHERLEPLSGPERARAFRAEALRNLAEHPEAYIRNWIANVGRILISYPYGYTPQKITTFFYLVPNMILLALTCFSLYPAYLARRQLPAPLISMLLFALVTFGGSSLVSASVRHFIPIAVVLFVWNGMMYARFIRIEAVDRLKNGRVSSGR